MNKVGYYGRCGKYISKCIGVYDNEFGEAYEFESDIDDAKQAGFNYDEKFNIIYKQDAEGRLRFSDKLVSLIEYGDAMKIKGETNYIDISGNKGKISFLNLAFCDGFTTIDNESYMIVNIKFLIKLTDLNIEQVLTKEYINEVSYKVGGNK